MRLDFAKGHGTRNDFVIFADPDNLVDLNPAQVAYLCDRRAGIGGDHPIRVQSMTTTDTMDTLGTVEQTIRMVNSGCEYVRITAPSMKEAENLANIKKELRYRGYNVPLVADIHFTPNAAEPLGSFSSSDKKDCGFVSC